MVSDHIAALLRRQAAGPRHELAAVRGATGAAFRETCAWRAISPTMMIEGLAIAFASMSEARLARCVTIARSPARDASQTTATGVDGGIPAASRRCWIRAQRATPM